jgi:hypothetical protein
MLPPVTIAITQTVVFGSGSDQHALQTVARTVASSIVLMPIADTLQELLQYTCHPFHAAEEGSAINGESPAQ